MKKFFITIIRSAFAILAVILAAFLVAPMAQGIVNIGNIAGTLLCIWIFCVSVAPLHRAIRSLFCRHKLTKLLYRFVNVCFIIFAVYGAVVTSLMAWAALQTPSQNATVIVLGAQVKPWGPSAVLNGRISGAQRFLEEHESANAVLSGGQGSDEPTSEAQCMYDTLIKRGIDKSRLYMEDKSTNTTENIKNSVQVIEDNNLNPELAVATDFYHQLRVRIIMNQLGIEGSVGAVNSDTSMLYLPVFTVREWFALPYQVLFR